VLTAGKTAVKTVGTEGKKDEGADLAAGAVSEQ
jgi:hypothetical protein